MIPINVHICAAEALVGDRVNDALWSILECCTEVSFYSVMDHGCI